MGTGWLEPEGLAALIGRAKTGVAAAAIPLSPCVAVDRWLRVL